MNRIILLTEIPKIEDIGDNILTPPIGQNIIKSFVETNSESPQNNIIEFEEGYNNNLTPDNMDQNKTTNGECVHLEHGEFIINEDIEHTLR